MPFLIAFIYSASTLGSIQASCLSSTFCAGDRHPWPSGLLPQLMSYYQLRTNWPTTAPTTCYNPLAMPFLIAVSHVLSPTLVICHRLSSAVHVSSPALICFHRVSFVVTGSHLLSPGLMCCHRISCVVPGSHLVSPDLMCCVSGDGHSWSRAPH
jgi:hypothetical protein